MYVKNIKHIKKNIQSNSNDYILKICSLVNFFSGNCSQTSSNL